MEKTGHVYIFGLIGEQSDPTIQSITPADVQKQINESKDAEILMVHIHSRGGDVDDGFAMHDMLKASGKKIHTIIEGQCASIATIPALAGEIREMTENSEFTIHNPFTPGTSGDAAEIQKVADLLKGIQDKIAKFYADTTGGKLDAITELMKEDTRISADDAKKMNFVTNVIKTNTLKAVATTAKINDDTNNPQNKGFMDKVLKVIGTKLDAFVDKLPEEMQKAIKDKTKKDPKPQNKDFTLDSGKVISSDSEDDLAEGQAVVWKESGEAVADGEHKLADGTMITVTEGKVSAITPAEGAEGNEGSEGDDDEATKALKKEITQLKADKKKLEEEAEEQKEESVQLEAKIDTVIEAVGSDYVVKEGTLFKPIGHGDTSGIENRAERRKEYRGEKKDEE